MKNETEFQKAMSAAFGDNPVAPVMTYHPRMDIPNTTLGEVMITNTIAKSLGQQPKWIPYTYDIGAAKGKDWEKSAIAAYYENQVINIISPIHAGNNPVCAVKGYTAKNVKEFLPKVSTAFTTSLKAFNLQVDNIQLGHPLFHMKHEKQNAEIKTQFAHGLTVIQKGLEKSMAEINFSGQMTQFNCHMSQQLLGIDVDARPMDQILADDDGLINAILDNYEETQGIDGALLKVCIDNERIVVSKKGDTFLAADKEFSKDDIVKQVKNKTATISGEMFFASLNYLGHKSTICSDRSKPYYDQMHTQAAKISHVWGKPFDMKYVVYSTSIQGDAMNLSQTTSVMHVMDRIAPRSILVNGSFKPAEDTVAHLSLIGGVEAVPEEFSDLIPENSKQRRSVRNEFQLQLADVEDKLLRLAATKKLADEKALEPVAVTDPVMQENNGMQKLNETTVQAVEEKNPPFTEQEMKVLGKRFKCSMNDFGYMKKCLEDARLPFIAKSNQMKDYAALDQVFLGGTVGNDVNNGMVHRSVRFPSAFHFILSGKKIVEPEFEFTTANSSQYCLGTIASALPQGVTAEYQDAQEMFDDFFDPAKLPFDGMKKIKKQADCTV